MYEPDENDEEDTAWMLEEREEFQLNLDKDGDGYLDHQEITDWVLPEDFDHITEESKHLFEEADMNQVWIFCPVFVVGGFLGSESHADFPPLPEIFPFLTHMLLCSIFLFSIPGLQCLQKFL